MSSENVCPFIKFNTQQKANFFRQFSVLISWLDCANKKVDIVW